MEELDKLRQENEELNDKLIDLLFELQYNKQDELIEFVRDLYNSLSEVDKKLTKEEIIKNLKKYIENFIKDNNLIL